MDIIPTQTSLYVTFPPEILETIFRTATLKHEFYIDSHRYNTDESENNAKSVVDSDGWTRIPCDPVSIARACSQVCRFWRDIAVNAQLLWAPLLDTSDFPNPQTSGTMWWDEAVRRAGPDTPIWLTSANVADFDEDGDQSIITAYVLPVLQSHSTRIELLSLRLKLEGGLEADGRWRALLEIGHAAREISMQVSPFPNVISHNRDELKVSAFVNSPLRFIDTLTICGPMRWCDVFHVLSHMPQLRRLSLFNKEHDADPMSSALQAQTAPISMPFLDELCLNDMLTDVVHLLPRLTTAPGCSLMIKAHNILDDFPLQSGATIITFALALRDHIFNILQECTTVKLEVDPWNVRLEADFDEIRDADHSANGFWPGDRLLNALTIEIRNDEDRIPEWVHVIVTNALSATILPELEDLAITWNFNGDLMTIFDKFPHFFSRLTSLTTLSVGQNVLSSFINTLKEMTRNNQNRPPVFLPLLDTVCTDLQMNDSHYAEHVGLLRGFLNLRAFMRAPIHLVFEQGVTQERMAQEFGMGMNPGLRSIRVRQ